MADEEEVADGTLESQMRQSITVARREGVWPGLGGVSGEERMYDDLEKG